jgi:lipoate-protein ligase A
MTAWHLLREGRCPSLQNMARDLELFKSVAAGVFPGVFRIYNWDRPAITSGHHQKGFAPHDPGLALPVVRRPTGGGAVLHLDDITFSISAPENGPFPGGVAGTCGAVSRIFAQAMRDCGLDVSIRGDSTAFSQVCFMRSSPVELCLDGRKVMGLALLRRTGCILVQGVIPLRADTALSRRVFGRAPDVQGLCDRDPSFDPDALIGRLLRAFSPEADAGVRFIRSTDR